MTSSEKSIELSKRLETALGKALLLPIRANDCDLTVYMTMKDLWNSLKQIQPFIEILRKIPGIDYWGTIFKKSDYKLLHAYVFQFMDETYYVEFIRGLRFYSNEIPDQVIVKFTKWSFNASDCIKESDAVILIIPDQYGCTDWYGFPSTEEAKDYIWNHRGFFRGHFTKMKFIFLQLPDHPLLYPETIDQLISLLS